MFSQLPQRSCKIVPIVIAIFGGYILLSLAFSDFGESVWSQQLSHFSRSGIRDGDFDHIQNTTLGVSLQLLNFAQPRIPASTNILR